MSTKQERFTLTRAALTFAWLALVAFNAACTEGRTPSAPSLTAHRSRGEFPSPQGYPLLAHDPVTDRVWLVGGFTTDFALLQDLWTFSTRSRAWTPVGNPTGPTSWDATALDAQSRKLILYQGYSAAFDAVDVQTWAYDVESGVWENRTPAVQPPSRWGSIMVYDPEADRVLLYGGANFADGLACGFCGATTVFGDLWAYDYESNTWTERHPSVSPPPHHFPVLVYVPTIDRTVLFGGFQQGFTSLFNDTWSYDYDANRWTDLDPDDPPAPRAYHYMALEPKTNRIVMFGGTLNPSESGEEVPIDETWIYDVSGNSWQQAFPKESPGPHAWHVMGRTSGPVLLFGGGDSRATWTNDTYLYSSRSNRWEHVAGGGAGSAPAGIAVHTPGAMSGGGVGQSGGRGRGH